MRKDINEPKVIMAQYNEKTVRVYQAYNHI